MRARARRIKPWERSPGRIAAFVAVAALALITLIVRLFEVQVADGERYHAAALTNQVRLIPVAAPRGTIFDRNHRVIVRSRPSFVIAFIPSLVKDAPGELRTISQVIGTPERTMEFRLLHHHGVQYRDFDQVSLYEPYGPVILADDLTVAQVARLSEMLRDLPGVDLEVQPVRNYPYKSAGSAIFGFVGQITSDEFATLKYRGYSPNDVIGKDGLERVYDRFLKGQPGGQRVVVDAQNQVVPDIRLPARQPIPGDSITLTVDWRLQAIAEKALADGIRKWSSKKSLINGAVVIEDPWSGGILALASYPGYDPNAFATDKYPDVGRYLLDPRQPLFNRAIAAATPTGSTFKMITGSAALSAPVVRVNETVYDSGAWNCGGYIARDIASGGLGNTQFVRALAASSDGYFYQMGWRLGIKRLTKYAREFGIARRSGIDLPGEISGNLPSNAWSMRTFHEPLEPAEACFLAIGQGALQASPLQMANVESAVVNGGTLWKPHIVSAILNPHGHLVKAFPPTVIRHVGVTQAALRAVREGMSKVTDPGGTAYGLAISGLPYGGKTGTAETGNGAGANSTWFVAYAPAAHARLAMAVFVDRSGGYGASVAAPIAREIMVKYFRKKE